MKRRRRNQPKLESLSLLARFLNHACEQEGVSQAELAKKIDTSTATVSRWFRDEMKPTEDDLKEISKAIRIPVENFFALQILDSMGPDKPMMATTGAFYLMASCKTSTLLLAGITMLAGIVMLRGIPLKNKKILINLIDPDCKDASRLENELEGSLTGGLLFSWLNAITIITKEASREKTSELCIRLRKKVKLYGPYKGISQLVANDWIAIVSDTPMQHHYSKIIFYGEPEWTNIVQPIIDGTNCKKHRINDNRGSLLLCSKWLETSKKFSEFKKAMRLLTKRLLIHKHQ